MNDRLLSLEEQNTIANNVDESSYETSVAYWEAIIEKIKEAQDAKTRELTLKELSEWLQKVVNEGGVIPYILLNSLKKGVMPDG